MLVVHMRIVSYCLVSLQKGQQIVLFVSVKLPESPLVILENNVQGQEETGRVNT